MSTRKKLRGAADYHAKCDAPVEEFVSFAKGLQRGKRSLEALAASPAADRFANRLVAEALSGEAHAPACLSLIGHFVTDEFWLGKLRSNDPTGDAPSPNELRPKDVEAVSRAHGSRGARFCLSGDLFDATRDWPPHVSRR